MLAIFLQTLPFFALIGVGYIAGRTGFFSAEATANLTKFIFYFALSAMLFRFAANLSLSEILDWSFIWAYLLATLVVYLLATVVALVRGLPVAEMAIEAQVAVIGNVGFLGIPMLAMLLGEQSIGLVMMVLAVDLIVFSSLVVILITGSQDGRVSFKAVQTAALGVLKNPMVMSIAAGLAVSALDIPVWTPINEFLALLGAAATPGALFAIGASLAGKSAERVSVALWLTVCKLALHPLAVGISALVLFQIDAYAAGVMIAAAALPVAGNVYMIAQHYGVAPQRASAAILISTILSVLTVTLVIGWVTTL